MFSYWMVPKPVQKLIQWVTPKSDTFEVEVTLQDNGEWVFSKGLIANEPFCGGSDWVISTILSFKTGKIPQPGAKATVFVSVNETEQYDTCFSDPVPVPCGHQYFCSYTKTNPFVCDVKDVFMSKTDKFYITVTPIAN